MTTIIGSVGGLAGSFATKMRCCWSRHGSGQPLDADCRWSPMSQLSNQVSLVSNHISWSTRQADAGGGSLHERNIAWMRLGLRLIGQPDRLGLEELLVRNPVLVIDAVMMTSAQPEDPSLVAMWGQMTVAPVDVGKR
jgi:hypothetical protein